MLRLPPTEITLSQRDVDEAFVRMQQRQAVSMNRRARPQPRRGPNRPLADLPRLRRGPERSRKESFITPIYPEAYWQNKSPSTAELSSEDGSFKSNVETPVSPTPHIISRARDVMAGQEAKPTNTSLRTAADATDDVESIVDLEHFRFSGFSRVSLAEDIHACDGPNSKRNVNTDGASDYHTTRQHSMYKVRAESHPVSARYDKGVLNFQAGGSTYRSQASASMRTGDAYHAHNPVCYHTDAHTLHSYDTPIFSQRSVQPHSTGAHLAQLSWDIQHQETIHRRLNRHVSDNILEFGSHHTHNYNQHHGNTYHSTQVGPPPHRPAAPFLASSAARHHPQQHRSLVPTHIGRARSEELIGHPSRWSRHGRQVYHGLAIEAAVRNFSSPLEWLERRFAHQMLTATSFNPPQGESGHGRRSVSQQLLRQHPELEQSVREEYADGRARALSAGSQSIAKVHEDAEKICAGFSDSTADLHLSFVFPEHDSERRAAVCASPTNDTSARSIPSPPATASTVDSSVIPARSQVGSKVRALEHAIQDLVAQECLVVSEQMDPNPIERHERTRSSMHERRSAELTSLRSQRLALEAELKGLVRSTDTRHPAAAESHCKSPQHANQPGRASQSPQQTFNSSPPSFHPSPQRPYSLSPSPPPPSDLSIDGPSDQPTDPGSYYTYRRHTPPPPAIRPPRYSLPSRTQTFTEMSISTRSRPQRPLPNWQIDQENSGDADERAMLRELSNRERRLGLANMRGPAAGQVGDGGDEEGRMDDTPPGMGRFQRRAGEMG